MIAFSSELTDAILDLDIFNLSSSSATDASKKVGGITGVKRLGDVSDDLDIEDTRSLFWQPGKRGYYSPRPGKNTPERLNAFRNVGRLVVYLCCNSLSDFVANIR